MAIVGTYIDAQPTTRVYTSLTPFGLWLTAIAAIIMIVDWFMKRNEP
jgi:hypothetical protein